MISKFLARKVDGIWTFLVIISPVDFVLCNDTSMYISATLFKSNLHARSKIPWYLQHQREALQKYDETSAPRIQSDWEASKSSQCLKAFCRFYGSRRLDSRIFCESSILFCKNANIYISIEVFFSTTVILRQL